jgi:cadmium resistance protein CadD (predicted permease)
MSSPERVPIRLRDKTAVYLAIVFFGIPVLGFWIFVHLGSIDLICSCVPFNMFPKWASESSLIGGIFTLIPIFFADWFVWTRWHSYRQRKVWSAKYADDNKPWYAKTGEERPKGPIKNKYNEP